MTTFSSHNYIDIFGNAWLSPTHLIDNFRTSDEQKILVACKMSYVSIVVFFFLLFAFNLVLSSYQQRGVQVIGALFSNMLVKFLNPDHTKHL